MLSEFQQLNSKFKIYLWIQKIQGAYENLIVSPLKVQGY